MAGLKQTTTGDTLADPNKPVILESMTFPAPVIELAIEPKTKGDQEKLGIAIQKLAEEDPTFRVHNDEETGQTVISGMGELHLEILVDRMRREFKVEANIGKPQVAYRETIRRVVEVEDLPQEADRWFRPVRQGAGQPGAARADHRRSDLRVRQQGHRWSDPEGVHSLGRRGAQEAMPYGILAGYPLVGVKMTLPTVRTTRSTLRRWRSRSPARW